MADEIALQEVDQRNQANEFDEYIRIVLGNIKVIIAITIVVMLGSTVYFSMIPNYYQATTSILVEKPQNKAKTYEDFMMPALGDEDYYGTQIAVITGRKISEAAVQALALDMPYEIQARRIRGTRILSLTITCGTPELAASIANKIAEIYVKESSEQSLYMSKQLLNLLPEGAGTGLEITPEFNRQEFLESMSGISGSKDIQLLKSQKLEIEGQMKEFSSRYRPEHPVIKELNEKLKYVDQELQERMKSISTNLKVMMGGEVKINPIRVLEDAQPPASPAGPNRLLGIFLATLMGFFGGVTLVLTREFSNQKIRTESDLNKHIRLPCLGHIPLVKEISRGNRGTGKKRSIVNALKENTVLADAVGSVRTHILFSMPYEKSKRIMFSSVIPMEGKTTASALLSLSLASLNRKILLMDADLRKPSVHTYFNLPNNKGLTDYLVGNATMDEIIQDTEEPNLKIITGGTSSPNPAELLSSERFRKILDEASARFDRIIVDVPPALFIPDALVVAKHVHSGVLVCGAGMVHKKSILAVKEKFAAIGHAFIGAVINRANYEKDHDHYHYYKRYTSYYAHRPR